MPKKLYGSLVSRVCEKPTAQRKFDEMFPDPKRDWSKIYSSPFQVALDAHTREFQYEVVNGILFTNSKLCKFGLVESPLCTFCGKEEETPEHLFALCSYSSAFWNEIYNWLQQCDTGINADLSKEVNVIFGFSDLKENFLSVNHIVLLAKQTIVLCRKRSINSSLNVLHTLLRKIIKIEQFIAKQKNKLHLHLAKWEFF